MLPQGAWQHESEGEIAFIWYSRWTKDETGTFPGTAAPRKTSTAGDDALLIRLVSSSAEYQQIYSGRTEPGQTAAKKTQHGTEFWYPNVIGRSYQIVRQVSGATGESGISPRMHWRRGHWRKQPYGPQQSLRRDQWIEPMLVAADTHAGSNPKGH